MGAFVCKLNVVSSIDFIEKLAFEQIIEEQWDKPYKYLVKDLSLVGKKQAVLKHWSMDMPMWRMKKDMAGVEQVRERGFSKRWGENKNRNNFSRSLQVKSRVTP